MSSAVKIVSLPLGFSNREIDGPNKQQKRRSSVRTAQTEECSMGLSTRSSFGSINTLTVREESKFNDSFEFLTTSSASDEGDVSAEALDQLTDLKTATESRFETLTRELAQLKEGSRREERKLRKMKRQARINKAQRDYLKCLEAMSLTELSEAPELQDEDFLKERGLEWKEVAFDW